MFERFLDTPKGFMVPSLISKHLKHCLDDSEADTDNMFFIKKLPNPTE